MKQSVRIGNGQGFWGDSPDAPVELILGGPVDYVGLDYLAEVTLSIMMGQKLKDPSRGYARDFLDLVARVLPTLVERNVRLITNAGGLNPEACREGVFAIARKLGVSGFRVATVSGDDLMSRLDTLLAAGHELRNMDTGEPLARVRKEVSSANAYIGARPIVEALEQQALIVLTGRATDTALTLAPLVHEFGWASDDWDRLAAGTIAGHILECGAQCTGGNYTRWWEVPELDRVGYPIVEAFPDGTFVVTKHEGTGGLVDIGTVSEQLVYEMGDPARYITPDCTARFDTVCLEAAGKDRVRVFGIRGEPNTPTLKVSASYLNGYKASGQLTVVGPDAFAKARLCADILWKRLERAGVTFPAEDRSVEFLGLNSCLEGTGLAVGHSHEVVLRVGVRDRDYAKVERFGKELAPLVTSGPPGVTGFAGGRPKPSPVVAYWPALLDREQVEPHLKVTVESV
jgi:acyclic terpene utilization AtuA family protein